MNRLPAVVTLRAEAESREAAQWYEERSQGLGAAFLEIVEKTLVDISENPFQFPVVYRDTRRALLERFPYGIFFRIQPGRIRVIAIMRQSRNPRRWQTRR